MDDGLIDTSILLEPFTQKGINNYKKRCFYLLKNPKAFRINPVISLSVLGELDFILRIKDSFLNTAKRTEMIDIHEKFFNLSKKIGINREAIKFANRILDLDPYLDPLDVLHISCAMISNCKTFIFIDKKLKDNMVLKKIIKEEYPNFYLTPFNISKNED